MLSHIQIYKKSDEINCIFHIHNADIISVATNKNGLLPLTQSSSLIINKIKYLKYSGIFNKEEIDDLKNLNLTENDNIILLENHGAFIFHNTIPKTFNILRHLINSCVAQNKILSTTNNLENLILIDDKIINNQEKYSSKTYQSIDLNELIYDSYLRKYLINYYENGELRF